MSPENLFSADGERIYAIHALRRKPRMTRYELGDYEWRVIKPIVKLASIRIWPCVYESTRWFMDR
jgi:hypothetical protein